MTTTLRPDARVLVLGAGPGGLGVAYNLVERGHTNVTVLERAPVVGGKCATTWAEGRGGMRPYDLGAIIGTPEYYYETRRLAGRLGLPLIPARPRFRYADVTTGELFPPTTPSITALARYIGETIRHRNITAPGTGYVGADPALAAPFAVWAAERGMEDMVATFTGIVSTFGYGYLDTTPAAYVLKYMHTREVLLRLLPAGMWNPLAQRLGLHELPRYFRFAHGFRTLATAMAAELPDVRTGANVARITRDGPHAPVVCEYVDAGGGEHTVHADVLVLACPLDLASVPYLDCDTEEKNLFADIIYETFFSTLVRVRGIGPGGASLVLRNGSVEVPDAGKAVLVAKLWDDVGDDGFVVYSMSRQPCDVDTVRRNVAPAVELLGGEVIDMLETKEWRFFPHVGTESFASGFYDKLDAMQGRHNTYYAGGLLNFETVETTLAYSRRLVTSRLLG
jgi:glycine/D-amino acid oxidase-like deaminating enzyme